MVHTPDGALYRNYGKIIVYLLDGSGMFCEKKVMLWQNDYAKIQYTVTYLGLEAGETDVIL